MEDSSLTPSSRAPEYVYRIVTVAVALILLLTWLTA